MYVFHRTVSIGSGKLVPAVVFSNEMVALIKDTTGVEMKVTMPISGDPNQAILQTSFQRHRIKSSAPNLSPVLAQGEHE